MSVIDPGISCTIDPTTGNLVLSLDRGRKREARAFLKDALRRRRDEVSVLWDALEPYWANGRFSPFSAEDANPFVGLTSAPCIAEEMAMDDDGNNTIVGRFWFFDNYMLESPVETLIEAGRVEFTLAQGEEEAGPVLENGGSLQGAFVDKIQKINGLLPGDRSGRPLAWGVYSEQGVLLASFYTQGEAIDALVPVCPLPKPEENRG